jgi:hypothetical protein
MISGNVDSHSNEHLDNNDQADSNFGYLNQDQYDINNNLLNNNQTGMSVRSSESGQCSNSNQKHPLADIRHVCVLF